VSTLEQPEEPKSQAYPPEEAIRRARPLPLREDLVIKEVSEDEWVAFMEALADA